MNELPSRLIIEDVQKNYIIIVYSIKMFYYIDNDTFWPQLTSTDILEIIRKTPEITEYLEKRNKGEKFNSLLREYLIFVFKLILICSFEILNFHMLGHWKWILSY